MNTGNGPRVISGGQTGADMAALRAARRLGFATGGSVPGGFAAQRGLNEYGVTEVRGGTFSAQLVRRSQLNVDAADATLAIRLEPSPGTDATIGYALTGRWGAARLGAWAAPAIEPRATHRPVLIIQALDAAAIGAAREFLHRRRVRVLNVCGHRACGRVPNFEAAVEHLLFRALAIMDGDADKRVRDDPADDDAVSAPKRAHFFACRDAAEAKLLLPRGNTLGAVAAARVLLADADAEWADLDARAALALAFRGVHALPGALVVQFRDASCARFGPDAEHVDDIYVYTHDDAEPYTVACAGHVPEAALVGLVEEMDAPANIPATDAFARRVVALAMGERE